MALSHSPSIVTNGLILNLDAGNPRSYPRGGTTWNDLSGNNNNATLINGPIYNNANQGGIILDGNGDYISVTENANMKPQILTAEIAIKINSTANTTTFAPITQQYVMFRQNSRAGNFEGYQIVYSESTQSYYCTATPSTGTPQYSVGAPGNTSPIGKTSFVCAVFNSTTMSIYIDGVFMGSGIKANGIDYNNNHTLKIGRSVPTGNTYDAHANGTVYSVKLYNRALSASEIAQNFNALRGRFGV